MIVLDTHIVIWMASDPKRLSKKASEAIRQARSKTATRSGITSLRSNKREGVAIATITLWEMAWLAENGRIQVVGSVESFVRETAARVMLQPVSPEIASLAVRLPSSFPKDPADRLITATAMVEGALLVTADEAIRRASVVQTIW